MDADQILMDVLTDRAEGRSDAYDVLSAVHRRLEHQRRVPAGRAFAVAGAVAAVAVTGVAAAAIAAPSHHASNHSGIAAASQPKAPRGHHRASAPDRTKHGATTPKTNHAGTKDDDYSTIAAGWLPGPAHEVSASRVPGFEERDYDATVNGVDVDVIIYLESGTQLPDRTEAGSDAQPLTINGDPAVEFVAPNATILAFNLGNGEIAYAGPSVVAPTDQVTTADITAIAEHVATDMLFNQHDPMPPQSNNTRFVQNVGPKARRAAREKAAEHR